MFVAASETWCWENGVVVGAGGGSIFLGVSLGILLFHMDRGVMGEPRL